MPVDRPDPTNGPDGPDEPSHRRRPDDPRPPGTAPSLPLDRTSLDAVHRANRAQVEQIYAAHRESAGDGAGGAAADGDADHDPWSEALPSLRAAWEEHEDRYPERERVTPQTHMDGSWSSGETRRLTPEQNTEATKACADIHDEGERVILPALRQIEAADPHRPWQAWNTCSKERIASRRRSPSGFGITRTCLLGKPPPKYRMPCDSRSHTVSRITPTVFWQMSNACRGWLRAREVEEPVGERSVQGRQQPVARPETGLRFEVQFHTPQSREAKELTHQAYERLRDPLTSKAEETELEAYQRRVNALVKRPPDVFRIEDYPPEKRDG